MDTIHVDGASFPGGESKLKTTTHFGVLRFKPEIRRCVNAETFATRFRRKKKAGLANF